MRKSYSNNWASTLRNRQEGKVFIYLLFILVALYASVLFLPQLLLPFLSNYLEVRDQPARTDAIIVLLGGQGPSRVVQAHNLFQAKMADKIVFGSGFKDKKQFENLPENFIWPTSSVAYELGLKSLGVEKENMVIVDTSSAFDTAHELRDIGSFVRSKGWTSVALVTSATHSRRASIIWRRLNPDIVAISLPAPSPKLDSWWKHGQLRRAVGYEAAALTKELWAQIEAAFMGILKGLGI